MSKPDGRKPTPWEILGLSPEAGDAEIRAAYLAKVKQYPPDRMPEDFERVRDAYGVLRDPRRRAESLLLAVDPDAPVASLLDGAAPIRRFVGPELWLAILKERSTGGRGL